MRELMRMGASGALIVVIMVLGSLVLWVGVPGGWLWIGSQVQGSTGDLSTALVVMMLGVVVSVVVIAAVLAWLNRKHEELREARGLPERPTSVLERVLVVTAAFAIVGFSVWFFGFAGPGPSIAPK